MADKHVGTITASRGRPPRVRRAGSREWVEAPVGTRLYRGDRVRSEDGEAAIRHADGSTEPIRRGSLIQFDPPRAPKKVKKREVASGEVSFSAQEAGDALARSKEKKED